MTYQWFDIGGGVWAPITDTLEVIMRKLVYAYPVKTNYDDDGDFIP
jgi:hypothetical protein